MRYETTLFAPIRTLEEKAAALDELDGRRFLPIWPEGTKPSEIWYQYDGIVPFTGPWPFVIRLVDFFGRTSYCAGPVLCGFTITVSDPAS